MKAKKKLEENNLEADIVESFEKGECDRLLPVELRNDNAQ